jgi:hypothetical protein
VTAWRKDRATSRRAQFLDNKRSQEPIAAAHDYAEIFPKSH